MYSAQTRYEYRQAAILRGKRLVMKDKINKLLPLLITVGIGMVLGLAIGILF